VATAARRAWATAIGAAVVVHGLLVFIPVMDEREGAAATPPVVRVRLAAIAPPAEHAPSPATPRPDPAPRSRPPDSPAEPRVRAARRSPDADARAPLTTEPAEAIAPAPHSNRPHEPPMLPEGLVTEPPAAPSHDEGSAADNARALEAYAAEVRRAVEARKQYPRRAHKLRRQGTAEVDVTLTPDGRLAGPPALTRSSGWPSLDHEALRMVRTAAPFPRAPATATTPTITIRLPIRFSID